jgi:hypothetical protein
LQIGKNSNESNSLSSKKAKSIKVFDDNEEFQDDGDDNDIYMYDEDDVEEVSFSFEKAGRNELEFQSISSYESIRFHNVETPLQYMALFGDPMISHPNHISIIIGNKKLYKQIVWLLRLRKDWYKNHLVSITVLVPSGDKNFVDSFLNFLNFDDSACKDWDVPKIIQTSYGKTDGKQDLRLVRSNKSIKFHSIQLK